MAVKSKQNTVNPPDKKRSSPTPCKLDRNSEIGGRSGPEPTRYGDWEKKGRCIDF